MGGTFAGWLTVLVARLRKEDQEKRLSNDDQASSSFPLPSRRCMYVGDRLRSLVEGRSLSTPCRLCPAPLTHLSARNQHEQNPLFGSLRLKRKKQRSLSLD
jgi:hypothetical protein